LQVSVAIHGLDIAVGSMSPEQYTLSQEEIETVLHYKELDSYLFTFGKAQKALTIFSLSKNEAQISLMCFQKKEQCPAEK
jgi:hypothetical protein